MYTVQWHTITAFTILLIAKSLETVYVAWSRGPVELLIVSPIDVQNHFYIFKTDHFTALVVKSL